jgi:hypothetical protein
LLAAKVPVATQPLALPIMTVAAVVQALESLMAAMQKEPSQRITAYACYLYRI